MQAVSARCVSALCAAVLCLVALPATAMATSTQGEIDTAIAKAVEYVRGQQDPATGEPFGFEHGSFSSDWVATSLAAAGVSAADVGGAGNPSLQDFLFGDYSSEFWSGGAGETFTTVSNYERATLVSHAAGLDPARLAADANLPSQIAERWNPAAPTFGEPNTTNTVFGVLALKIASVPTWALTPVASYLRQSQHDDGGWTYSAAATLAAKAEPSEPDMTGAAIAALCETGVPPYDPDLASALSYLHGLLVDTTGAIHYAFGDNSDATAWAVSGLSACGIDPQSAAWTTPSGKTPIDHLLSLQLQSPDPEAGGFGYSDTSEANLYSTQDALRAIAGGVFTAAPPARDDPSQPNVRPVPTVAAGTLVPHLLAIELAPGNVRMCKVTAPNGAPLTQVLSAAKAAGKPAGCVTAFSVAGQVDSIDGFAPADQDEAWLLRLDRGSATVAGQQPVGFGDVISLRLGESPRSHPGPTGPSGAGGKAGEQGPRGKRGAKGRPGHNAHISCRARHRRQTGKARIRCGVKKGRAQRNR